MWPSSTWVPRFVEADCDKHRNMLVSESPPSFEFRGLGSKDFGTPRFFGCLLFVHSHWGFVCFWLLLFGNCWQSSEEVWVPCENNTINQFLLEVCIKKREEIGPINIGRDSGEKAREDTIVWIFSCTNVSKVAWEL